jgi:hypothetical protein
MSSIQETVKCMCDLKDELSNYAEENDDGTLTSILVDLAYCLGKIESFVESKETGLGIPPLSPPQNSDSLLNG